MNTDNAKGTETYRKCFLHTEPCPKYSVPTWHSEKQVVSKEHQGSEQNIYTLFL